MCNVTDRRFVMLQNWTSVEQSLIRSFFVTYAADRSNGAQSVMTRVELP